MCTVHGVRFQHDTATFNTEISRSKLKKNEDEINEEPEKCEGHFRWSVSRIDLLFEPIQQTQCKPWYEKFLLSIVTE